MALAEDTKLRIDPLAGLGPRPSSGSDAPASANQEPAAQVDEAELAMRRALGLSGGPPRHRPDGQRADTPQRGPDRLAVGQHRRRFAQDGDIPVTVLRREPVHDVAQHRMAPTNAPVPINSRLHRAEAALAVATDARAAAERTLAETQTALRDLQTKIGHAELAKNEAIEALRREREGSATLRQELAIASSELADAHTRAAEVERTLAAREHALGEERQALRGLEESLRQAEVAREEAERRVRTLTERAQDEPNYQPPRRRRALPEPTARVVATSEKRARAARAS